MSRPTFVHILAPILMVIHLSWRLSYLLTFLAYSTKSKNPPEPPPVRKDAEGRTIPGFPAGFQPHSNSSTARRSLHPHQLSVQPVKRFSSKRQASNNSSDLAEHLGLPGRDLINPAYKI